MILGALFDLGLDFPTWKKKIDTLLIPIVHLELEKVSKQGIMAIRFHAVCPHEHVHRGMREIRKIIDASQLSNSVKEKSIQVFSRLAEVEAKIHGVDLEDVHFHEVGALDAIIDIVGACLGFEMFGIEAFYTTPFTFGTGTVHTQHGRMAVPVPATLALTNGFASRRTDLPGELCTPTGTALVTTFARPLPLGWTGVVQKQGYGAGTRDLPDMANVLRLCLMDAPAIQPSREDSEGYELYQVECNLDNMTPELIGYAVDRLFAVGCKDVWQESILMKKNRSAIKLCALSASADLNAVLQLFASETTTGGLRYFPVRRLVAEKSAQVVQTQFGEITMKGVRFPGMKTPRYTPEFESCRMAAQSEKIPLPEVYRAVMIEAARQLGSNTES